MDNIENFNMEIEELRSIKLQIIELRKLFDIINNAQIKQELKEIIIIAENIYKEVAVNTEKLRKIKNFSNYYLKTVHKILYKYYDLKDKKVNNRESEKLYKKVEEFIPQVKQGFKKMYDSLFSDDIIDIDAEMKVMFSQFK